MSTIAATESTRRTVELALRGRRLDVRGRAFQALLLLTLLISLGVLLVLLWTAWNTAARSTAVPRALGKLESRVGATGWYGGTP